MVKDCMTPPKKINEQKETGDREQNLERHRLFMIDPCLDPGLKN